MFPVLLLVALYEIGHDMYVEAGCVVSEERGTYVTMVRLEYWRYIPRFSHCSPP